MQTLLEAYTYCLERQHLLLMGLALGIALALALLVGILLTRVPWLRGLVLGVLGMIYTIPSLALLVVRIPFLGIEEPPALVALVAYAQLVLVRNTVVGLNGADHAIVEAARGMGMRGWQHRIRIELPLILAVIRLATLSIIAIGTVAFLVDAGGLGKLLFEGVLTSNPDKILAGSIAVAVLALLAHVGLRHLEGRAARVIHGEGRRAGAEGGVRYP